MNRRTNAIAVVGGFLAVLATAPLSAQDAVAIAETAGPAVVTLKVYDESGSEIGQGSGFFVTDGRIVTNTHVVEGATRVDIFDSGERLLGSVPYAEALSSTVDLAILPRLGAVSPAGLSLQSALPPAGAEVVVIGAPLGLSNTVSTGIVSAIRTAGGTLIQVTSPISPGSSGGPVLNADGRVIGVAVAMREDGQAINFAVPARDVAALLGSPPGRLAFPAVSNRHGAAAAASGEGRRDLEIALGETKTGTLTRDDPRLDDGEHYHSYRFQGNASDRITVSLNSSEFDSYLAIFTTDGEWQEQDDDSGGGSNAQLDVTLPASGTYVIAVTSYATDEVGSYSLSVRPYDPAAESDLDGWNQYASTAEGAELYYLPSSIRTHSTDVIEVWTRWIYSEMQPPSTSDESYDSEKRLIRVNCATERLGLVSFVEYAGDKTVNSFNGTDIEMIPAVPESVGASLLRRVCTDQSR